MLSGIRIEIGLRGLISLLQNANNSTAKTIQEKDFNDIKAKGLSEKNLEEIVGRLTLGQEMARLLGLEKAIDLRTTFSKTIAEDYMGKIYPAPVYLEACDGGFFPNWRRFVTSYITKCEENGIQAGIIVEQSSIKFEQRMTYCAYADVAEILGDLELCYWTTCIADDYFFPKYMQRGGCRYTRSGTLATGAPHCDFCYSFGE